jgi:CheY-like chemotaxis protein
MLAMTEQRVNRPRPSGTPAAEREPAMDVAARVAGSVGHELNNMLAILIGNLDMLSDRLADRPEDLELVAAGLRTVERGATLSRRLLAFAGRMPLRPRTVDLSIWLAAYVATIGERTSPSIAIGRSSLPSLPLVQVDPDGLRMALDELVANAVQAMPDGGRIDLALTTVSASETGQLRVAVSVTDTGVGMAESVRARAFEPFVSAQAGERRAAGMGLAQVHGFARASGGEVVIDSVQGRGTRVEIRLPIAVEAAEATDDAPVVLVVEDDERLRRVSLRQLHELGYRTIEADTAARGLEIMRSAQRIDLLFTDIMMPGGIDGWSLAREGERLRPGLKTLFTSGYAQETELDRRLIAKPFLKRELAHAVRQALSADEL